MIGGNNLFRVVLVLAVAATVALAPAVFAEDAEQAMFGNTWARNMVSGEKGLPTEFDAFGSDAMLQELREHPPDIVVVMHRRHGEFGVAAFGQDARFGRDLMAWIGAHYQRVERIGREPSDEAGFGILILRRRPPP